MANLTFPSNPTNGQKVTVNDKVFVYNSTTSRWTATRLQVLGNLTDDFTIDAPTLGVSLSTVALDTVGANVYITYTVDQDVKATLTTSGLENTTATLHQTNNTIVVNTGATSFSGGQINLVVTNGRTSDTETINVSAAIYSFIPDLNTFARLDSELGSTTIGSYGPMVIVDNTMIIWGGGSTSSNRVDIDMSTIDPSNLPDIDTLTITSPFGGGYYNWQPDAFDISTSGDWGVGSIWGDQKQPIVRKLIDDSNIYLPSGAMTQNIDQVTFQDVGENNFIAWTKTTEGYAYLRPVQKSGSGWTSKGNNTYVQLNETYFTRPSTLSSTSAGLTSVGDYLIQLVPGSDANNVCAIRIFDVGSVTGSNDVSANLTTNHYLATKSGEGAFLTSNVGFCRHVFYDERTQTISVVGVYGGLQRFYIGTWDVSDMTNPVYNGTTVIYGTYNIINGRAGIVKDGYIYVHARNNAIGNLWEIVVIDLTAGFGASGYPIYSTLMDDFNDDWKSFAMASRHLYAWRDNTRNLSSFGNS
jgi:hypothetical protein